jgi:hypothetical protein
MHPWTDDKSTFPPGVVDMGPAVHLMPGERGISVNTKPRSSGTLLHRVFFSRNNIGFYGKQLSTAYSSLRNLLIQYTAVIAQTHLRPGEQFRSTAEKLAEADSCHN